MWTTTVPTVEGWYWFRQYALDDLWPPQPALVYAKNTRVFCLGGHDWPYSSIDPRSLWSGPITPPVMEPT
jgi:hypothetical protein